MKPPPPTQAPPPGIASTVVVTLLLGVLGLIPAIWNTRSERRQGRPTRRYWTAFWWSILGNVVVAGGLVAGLLVATDDGNDTKTVAAQKPTASVAPQTSKSTRVVAVGAAFTDPNAVRALLSDTSSDVATTNTYDYRNLAVFRRDALAVTTGSFTEQMRSTIDDLIEVNAPKLHARQHAEMVDVGVSSMTTDTAKLVVFGKLAVSNTEYPNGRTDPFEAVVTVANVGGRWLLTDLRTSGAARCAPPGTPDLAHAAASAEVGAAALTTYHRSTFEADYERTLSMTTAPLREDMEAQRARTLKALRAGHFDLHAEATACAVASADDTSAVILVALNGYRSGDPTPSPQQLAVTVEKVGGRWLMSDVHPVTS